MENEKYDTLTKQFGLKLPKPQETKPKRENLSNVFLKNSQGSSAQLSSSSASGSPIAQTTPMPGEGGVFSAIFNGSFVEPLQKIMKMAK